MDVREEDRVNLHGWLLLFVSNGQISIMPILKLTIIQSLCTWSKWNLDFFCSIDLFIMYTEIEKIWKSSKREEGKFFIGFCWIWTLCIGVFSALFILCLKCGFLKKSFIINAPLCSWTSLHHILALLNSKRCIHNKWLIKKSTL